MEKPKNETYDFDCQLVCEMFYSEESGYGVAKVFTKTKLKYSKQRDCLFDDKSNDEYEVIIVGSMPKLEYGITYHVKNAIIKNHQKFGKQYAIMNIAPDKPTTVEQQAKFLQSVINKSQADSLLKMYPNIVEMIIQDQVNNIDLSNVKGVGEKTFEKIKDKVIDNYAIQDLLITLLPLGVTRKLIDKLIKGFDKNALQIKKMIENNPYILTRIRGLGFAKVDKIALKLKPELICSEFRTIAYLRYYFKQLANLSGDTYTTKRILSKEVNKNIPECKEPFMEIVKREEEKSNFLSIQDSYIGLKFYRNLEQSIIDRLEDLNKQKSIFEKFTEEEVMMSIRKTEAEQGFEFDEKQREAIIQSNNHNVIIITAPAGGGKSSVLKGVVNLYKEGRLKENVVKDVIEGFDRDTTDEYIRQFGDKWKEIARDDIYRDIKISQCALSARAAKRIKQTTSLPSATIHRTLGANGNGFNYSKEVKMPHYVNVIDEMSMVNLEILNSYFQAIKDGSKLILVFDFAQLPPIGSGDMSRDLLGLKNLYISIFTKIYRQGASSAILLDSNMVRKGFSPFDGDVLPKKAIHGELKDMTYLFSNNLQSIQEVAIKRYLQASKEIGLDDVMLITPKRKSGAICSNVLNMKIQDILLEDENEFLIQKSNGMDIKFKLGARVIYRKNNYEKTCFNGDEGYLTEISKGNFVIEFLEENGRKQIEFPIEELVNFDLGYCVSVHFSQGSQAHTTIAVMDNSSYIMLNRRILYTALTRAQKRGLLISQPKAFLDCIADVNNKPRRTWTDLKIKGEIK